MKKCRAIILGILMFIVGIFATGCGSNTDYSDYFSVSQVNRFDDDKENMIEVEYEINNLGKKDNLIFCVTVDGMTEKYSVSPESKKTDKKIIDIGRPDNFQLSYPVIFEVKKNSDVIWSKEENITYDCSEMFQHKATIKYGDKTAEISLIDYKSNFFDLAELFSDYDANTSHNVEINNAKNDLARIQEREDSVDGSESVATGSILRLATFGKEEINDTYHFSDDLEIVVTNAIPASSVNWAEHMKFSDDSHYSSSSVYGISVTTYEMDVMIDNPSDETVYGSVTKFYVNDKPVSDEYLAASEHRSISSGETDKVYNISGASVWETTGETNIKKFGLKVKLEDSNGKVLYNDIQWLYLK